MMFEGGGGEDKLPTAAVTADDSVPRRESIQVFVRVRPLLPGREIDAYALHARSNEDDVIQSNTNLHDEASCVEIEQDERTVS